jgi:hypothetical protein
MSFNWIFGNIFELIIFFAIAKFIYKSVIKGRSETLDRTVTKFVNQVKNELSFDDDESDKPKTHATPKTKIQDDYNFSSKASGSYANADDLLKSGLITKEEYRKIKK